MKTSQQFSIDIAAILTTLAETPKPVPASLIYLAFGADMERYERVVRVLANTGYLTRTAETLEITDKGKKVAAEIEAVLAARKAS